MSANDAPWNLISLDGGGVRGVFSARLIARLVELAPELRDRTRLYAGTSTGAIIAAGLASGMSPRALVRLYETHTQGFFDRRWGWGVTSSRYSPDRMRSVLDEVFEQRTLGELERWVLIPALRLDDGGKPRRAAAKFYESKGDAGKLVVDALMASTAAPSYFPAFEGHVDGGLVANSPSIHAAAQALEYGARPEQIRLLSIGTGLGDSAVSGSPDWGVAQWASRIAGLTIDGVSGVSDYLCRQTLGDGYHRLDGALEQPTALDDVAAIPALIRAADAVDLRPTYEWLARSGWAGGSKEAA